MFGACIEDDFYNNIKRKCSPREDFCGVFCVVKKIRKEITMILIIHSLLLQIIYCNGSSPSDMFFGLKVNCLNVYLKYI